MQLMRSNTQKTSSQAMLEHGQASSLSPTKSIFLAALYGGANREREVQEYQFFVEHTLPILEHWCRRDHWLHVLISTASTNPAIRDIMVAIASTDREWLEPVPLVEDDRDPWDEKAIYYHRAVGAIARNFAADLQILLLASAAFALYDCLNGRLHNSFLHVRAMSKLLHAARGAGLGDTLLIKDLEEIVCMAAALPNCWETGISLEKASESDPSEGFGNLILARASLNQCIWAIGIAQEHYSGAMPASLIQDQYSLTNLVFRSDPETYLDFDGPPIATPGKCRKLLNDWLSRLASTSNSIVPEVEKKALLLHVQGLELALGTMTPIHRSRGKVRNPDFAEREDAMEKMVKDCAVVLQLSRVELAGEDAGPREHIREPGKVESNALMSRTSVRGALCFIGTNTRRPETMQAVISLVADALSLEPRSSKHYVHPRWMQFIFIKGHAAEQAEALDRKPEQTSHTATRNRVPVVAAH
jgi:hypothetical protein